MATRDYPHGVSFTYGVLHQGKPTILRGEFYKDGIKTGDALETVRPSMEEAVESILRYADLIAESREPRT